MEYTRPYLYPKQQAAFFDDARYILCEASTKAGKTVGAIAWILEQAFHGTRNQNYWWVAPVASQAEIAYRRVKANLTKGSFTSKDSPTPVITLVSGAAIWFKSGDNPDSLYGEDVFAGVVDEASRCKEESWNALRSTLTATRGPVRIIGNVKGRKNWFYRLSRMAQKGTPGMLYRHLNAYDAVEAGVLDLEEIEDAKRTLPENVFRELFLAIPTDDGGNPFGLQHIEACVRPTPDTKPVAFGVDLAKKQDFLVVIGLDVNGQVCVFERWQGVPWAESIRRIHEIVGEDIPALVDSTGIGDPVLEQLQIGHGNFSGFMFSTKSKQKLMEGLAVSIQSHEIGFEDGPIRTELDLFEYKFTATGVAYSAPDGMHDDCVMALALARQKWAEGAPAESLMQYYAANAQAAKEQIERDNVPSVIQIPSILLSPAETLDNELTELYTKTLKQYEPTSTLCAGCHKPVGASKISDGIFVWHPECASLGVRLAA